MREKNHRKPSFRWWGHSPAPQLGVLGWPAPQTCLMVLTLFSLGALFKGTPPGGQWSQPPSCLQLVLLIFFSSADLSPWIPLWFSTYSLPSCFLSLFLSIRMQTWLLPYFMTLSYKPVLPTQNSSPDTWEPWAWAPQSEFCVHSRVSS